MSFQNKLQTAASHCHMYFKMQVFIVTVILDILVCFVSKLSHKYQYCVTGRLQWRCNVNVKITHELISYASTTTTHTSR